MKIPNKLIPRERLEGFLKWVEENQKANGDINAATKGGYSDFAGGRASAFRNAAEMLREILK